VRAGAAKDLGNNREVGGGIVEGEKRGNIKKILYIDQNARNAQNIIVYNCPCASKSK
jgi:hypothetical protein